MLCLEACKGLGWVRSPRTMPSLTTLLSLLLHDHEDAAPSVHYEEPVSPRNGPDAMDKDFFQASMDFYCIAGGKETPLHGFGAELSAGESTPLVMTQYAIDGRLMAILCKNASRTSNEGASNQSSRQICHL